MGGADDRGYEILRLTWKSLFRNIHPGWRELDVSEADPALAQSVATLSLGINLVGLLMT